MKLLLILILFLPFLASSQLENDSLLLNSKIVAFPSSIQQFELVRSYDILDSSLLNISFKSKKSENQRALNAGVLEAQMNYMSIMDSSRMADLSPSFNNDSIGNNQIESDRETNAVTADPSEYILTLECQQKIKNDSENISLNYLFRIGEWTEAMFLISKYVRKEKDLNTGSRIIEQKGTVDAIVKILQEQDDQNLEEITKSFVKLQSIYSDIKTIYKYSKPKVDKKNHTTTITSKVITRNTRKSFILIEKQLNTIRESIIN